MRKTDKSHKGVQQAVQLNSSWLRALNRRELILAAGGSAAALLLPGCGGGASSSGNPGGGGGGFSLVPFTITPSRAAPGAMVTLTGLNLINSASIDVRFGGVPAIVHAQDSTGLQVLVPPFAAAGGTTSVPPASPVMVYVQANGQTQKSTNQFTVLPLPAAPGTATAVLQSFADMSSFFQGVYQSSLLPLFADAANPGALAQNAGAAVQGAAFCAAAADFFAGANNPNSFVNQLASLSASGAAGAAAVAMIDGMIAQGPCAGLVQDFAQTVYGGIASVAPGSITTKSASSRFAQSRDGNFSFADPVDWSQIDAAKRIIQTLQMQKLCAQIASSPSGNMTTAMISMGLSVAAVISAFVNPALAVVLGSVSLALDISTRIMGIMASTMPGMISDYYVVVNGTERRNGQPAVNIGIGAKTPLQVMLVTQSTGGLAFSILGVASSVEEILVRKVPALAALFKEAGAATVLKAEFDRLMSIGDTLWQLTTGGPPPVQWRATNVTNFPSIKYAPVNINSISVLTIVSNSPNLVTTVVDPATRAYSLQGKHEGGNAGYQCYIDASSLAPGYPALQDILGQKKYKILGFVNVAGGAVQLGIS